MASKESQKEEQLASWVNAKFGNYPRHPNIEESVRIVEDMEIPKPSDRTLEAIEQKTDRYLFELEHSNFTPLKYERTEFLILLVHALEIGNPTKRAKYIERFQRITEKYKDRIPRDAASLLEK
jgi:hypothetical protein